MNIITSGYPYIDIDAYAACIAYAELQNLLGNPSLAVSTAPLNESITPEVLSWQAPLETNYVPSKNNRFVLIDLSDPKFFEKFVVAGQVSEIIDHHPGFETYWQKHLGDRAQIESIGSVGTIIFERWQAAGMAGSISQLSARLLLTAILENTLNFGAQITHERDHAAYKALLKPAGLPPDWAEQYFRGLEGTISKDIGGALIGDTKVLPFKTFSHPLVVAQIVVWDGQKILDQYSDIIESMLANIGQPWFLNLVSVRQKKSYFLCRDAETKQWLGTLLAVGFTSSVGVANRLWLRKEIIKQDLLAFDK